MVRLSWYGLLWCFLAIKISFSWFFLAINKSQNCSSAQSSTISCATIQETLLCNNPLPSLGIVSSLSSNIALATTHSRLANESLFCKNCKLHRHKFTNCPSIECTYCHKRGHILDNCPNSPPRPPPPCQFKSKGTSKSGYASVVAVTTSSNVTLAPSLQISDLQELFQHVISSSSIALHTRYLLATWFSLL